SASGKVVTNAPLTTGHGESQSGGSVLSKLGNSVTGAYQQWGWASSTYGSSDSSANQTKTTSSSENGVEFTSLLRTGNDVSQGYFLQEYTTDTGSGSDRMDKGALHE